VPDRCWPGWAAATLALVVAWFAIKAQDPPSALPAEVSNKVFSAGRAQKHVKAIARKPHPMGSDESVRVRQMLIEDLRKLGVSAQVQNAKQPVSVGAQNVLARVKGQGAEGKKALMLCAHYDSVPESPGASDNGAGVAVVLETLRAVMAGAALERDLIVLFPDGEEDGFHGSHLFVNEHPWARDVGIVLNFDARGNSGPSIMFETSEENGWLISQFAQAVNQPLATSLSMDIYQVLPNDTDLTVFKRAGMGGLNFAFGSGLAYYHTADDTPANLDQRTLQHQGDNALATVRHLGQLDLDDIRRENVIYASILNRIVVSYSKAWVLPFAVVALVLYLAIVAFLIRSREMRLTDLTAGAGAVFISMVLSLLSVGFLFLLGVCWSILRGLSSSSPIPWLKYDVEIMTACALLAAGITMALTRWWANRRPLPALILGAFSWWLSLTLATALWLPGASYLFAWPTVVGLLGLGLSIKSSIRSALRWTIILLGSIPSLLLVAPLIRTTFDGLSLGMAAPITILVVLFTKSLMPLWGPLIVSNQFYAGQRKTPARAQLQFEVEHTS
jgi:hypothetical protein